MSVIVVDASVGVKWFVPEVHGVEARQWRNGPKAAAGNIDSSDPWKKSDTP